MVEMQIRLLSHASIAKQFVLAQIIDTNVFNVFGMHFA